MNWPTNFARATSVIWKQEERVALWYKPVNKDIEAILMWRGPAWAVPDALGGLFIERFFATDDPVNCKYLNVLLKVSDPRIIETNRHNWLVETAEFDRKYEEESKEC